MALRALVASVEVARRHGLLYDVAMGLEAMSRLWPDRLEPGEIHERDRLFDGLGIITEGRQVGVVDPSPVGQADPA